MYQNTIIIVLCFVFALVSPSHSIRVPVYSRKVQEPATASSEGLAAYSSQNLLSGFKPSLGQNADLSYTQFDGGFGQRIPLGGQFNQQNQAGLSSQLGLNFQVGAENDPQPPSEPGQSSASATSFGHSDQTPASPQALALTGVDLTQAGLQEGTNQLNPDLHPTSFGSNSQLGAPAALQEPGSSGSQTPSDPSQVVGSNLPNFYQLNAEITTPLPVFDFKSNSGFKQFQALDLSGLVPHDGPVIKVPVPQPYPVHIPVKQPITVPIFKLVPQEVEKKVPITVEKLVPVYKEVPVQVYVEKHHPYHVYKPYGVPVPVHTHILVGKKKMTPKWRSIYGRF